MCISALLREAWRLLPRTMHRTSQMILRLRLSSARLGWQSSRGLLGPGGSHHFTVPYSSTVPRDSRPLKGQHNFVHGVAKRSSSAYEAAASDEVIMRFQISMKSTGLGGYKRLDVTGCSRTALPFKNPIESTVRGLPVTSTRCLEHDLLLHYN